MLQKLLPFLGLILILGCAENKKQDSNTEQGSQPPNIVYIMADDHGYQAISAYGSELSKLAPTPNIDRIAKNGMRFDNAYVTNSLCGPSRAVILTGKFSHINGFRKNGDTFKGDQPTLPKKLQRLGYQTAIFGKWHLGSLPQGFDTWKIIEDQGHYYNPDFILQNGDTVREQGYATDIITKDALNWLKKNRKDSIPFFIMVEHKAAHRNWMPALRHLNKYDSINLPLPDTYFTDHKGSEASKSQLMTIYKDMYEGYDLKLTKALGSAKLAHSPWPTDFGRMTREQRAIWDSAYQPKNDAFHRAGLHGRDFDLWKGERYLRDYMATVASLDEGVGEILDYLEEAGLDKNTIVVYTSDQGFYLGEKGFFDKRYMYEVSFRTPLLIQYPGDITPGSTSKALVQNLDYAQTFLDYAGGGNLTDGMQGKSFRPILEGKMDDDDFRDVLYYHYYAFPAFHMVSRHYGIRTRGYKLMHFYDNVDAWEFYDLEKDAKEVHNLIKDPNYKEEITLMHKKLDSVQKAYKVTDKEFEKAPQKQVDQAYKVFKKLRGTPME